MEGDHKGWFFSQFTSCWRFASRKLGCHWRSKTNTSTAEPRDRQAAVDRFQTDARLQALLVSSRPAASAPSPPPSRFPCGTPVEPRREAQAMTATTASAKPASLRPMPIAKGHGRERVLKIRNQGAAGRRPPQRRQQRDWESGEGRFGVAVYAMRVTTEGRRHGGRAPMRCERRET